MVTCNCLGPQNGEPLCPCQMRAASGYLAGAAPLAASRSFTFTTPNPDDRIRAFAEELRKWWSFDDRQQHTHSWHSREDFIAKKLPELLRISCG